jgi:hypothetical protein
VKRLGGTLVVAVLALAVPAMFAGEKDKPKKAAEVVDAGSFGVFVNGKRAATEKFTIEKLEDGSVSSSELTVDDGNQKASQTSELRLASNGNLQGYSWKEQSPGKGEITVDPTDNFLMERITPSPGDKVQEMPFFSPHSTAILDDNFFTHRELLAWRYLAVGCRMGLGQTACRPPKMTFGVINPRQLTFTTVTMEYRGRETVKVAGVERELNRFDLLGDNMSWALWLDDQQKLVRILIPSDNIEVVRD